MTITDSCLTKDLTYWYSENYRQLPWRETLDPYKIWLSEIILQQTRVNQGLPYYNSFVSHYPDIKSFATADLDHILKLWQGLGYYSRARNMHTCANTIISEHKGRFPESYLELLTLKGIGKYTAAAISSICFNEAVPVVDGNVYRVISRLFGVKDDISQSKSFKVFFDIASQIIDHAYPGQFNQAIMELGAMICSPKNPQCDVCPIMTHCYAFAHSSQTSFPVKNKVIKVKNRQIDYHVIHSEGKVLIKQRTDKDIWARLFEFFLIENDTSKLPDNLSIQDEPIYEIKHILTHQRLHIRFFSHAINEIEMIQLEKNLSMKSVKTSEIGSFAIPKPIETFLKNWDFH